jgi:hypothetical protein
LRQLRHETQLVHDEIALLYWQQRTEYRERRRREVREARIRLEADDEGRSDAQARIDVAIVIDDQRERGKLRG